MGGGSSIATTLKVISQLSKKGMRVAVAELPCLGVPQLAYAAIPRNEVVNLGAANIDQLILDLDRQNVREVQNYAYSSQNVEYFFINPLSLPEAPTVNKITSSNTLMELPSYFKQKLADYDYLIFVVQGRLNHPATLFALREADGVILTNQDPLHFVGNMTHYKKLTGIFGLETERIFLYSDTSFASEEKVYTKISDVLKKWGQLEQLPPPSEKSVKMAKGQGHAVGIIEPLEYLNIRVNFEDQGNISEDDSSKLNNLVDTVRQELQEKHMDEYVNSLMNEQARQKFRYLIGDVVREIKTDITGMTLNEVVNWVQREITELPVIQEILDEPSISSIEINGPDQVIIEQDGVIKHREDLKFRDERHYMSTINRMLNSIGKPINSKNPVVDANYRGFRICVVADRSEIMGLSAKYPLVSIRKFPPDVYTNEQCISYGNISPEIAEFMEFILPKGPSVVVAGGTNSGKTTQLMRMPLFLDRLTRIVTIEDSEEMMLNEKKQYANYPNIVSLLSKEVEDVAKSFGTGKLVKTSMRLNPTYMMIGEIRDEEGAKQGVNAANTGHPLLTSTHANSCKAGAIRLLQLSGNTTAVASQIGDTIDLFISQVRLKNGVRTVTEISELLGYEGTDKPILNPIFKYNRRLKVHEQVGKLKKESLLERIYLDDTPQSIIDRWCEQPNETKKEGVIAV